MNTRLWKHIAIDVLRTIERDREALQNIREHIARLDEAATATKGAVVNATAVKGGMLNKEEERRLNILALKTELEISADLLKIHIDAFDRAWNQLSPEHQTALLYFYVKRPTGHVRKLMEKWNVEQSCVYRVKDEALAEFCVRMYGRGA